MPMPLGGKLYILMKNGDVMCRNNKLLPEEVDPLNEQRFRVLFQ